jgi:hypothetical protein
MVRRAGLQLSYYRLVSQCGGVTKIASFSHVSEKAAHDFATASFRKIGREIDRLGFGDRTNFFSHMIA